MREIWKSVKNQTGKHLDYGKWSLTGDTAASSESGKAEGKRGEDLVQGSEGNWI